MTTTTEARTAAYARICEVWDSVRADLEELQLLHARLVVSASAVGSLEANYGVLLPTVARCLYEIDKRGDRLVTALVAGYQAKLRYQLARLPVAPRSYRVYDEDGDVSGKRFVTLEAAERYVWQQRHPEDFLIAFDDRPVSNDPASGEADGNLGVQ